MNTNVPTHKRRRGVRAAAAVVAALMVWSIAGLAGPVQGDEPTPEEPENLSAYSTLADAMPVQTYFDHQARLVPLGPAISHSQTEVGMPSQASGIAWLLDNGIANGVNGTTTGTTVPTQASAQQPGGEQSQEFRAAGGPIGNEQLMRVEAGRAYAEATSADTTSSYANAYFHDLILLPAAGSPSDPPGTYEPDATFPGGMPGETDPAPRGQMAIMSIGTLASTTRSMREGDVVTSIAVAELSDVNIGNRTSDNRCTNCNRIDWLRVEAFAQTNGTPEGARAFYRVTGGRACHRGFDAETSSEKDECMPLDPHDPEGAKGLQSVDELEDLNDQFAQPFWTTISGGALTYTIGIRLHLGSEHSSPARSQRTASPADDPHRNYAATEKTGEQADALAEGLDVEVWTIATTQIGNDAYKRFTQTPAGAILAEIDQDDDSPGIQLGGPGQLGDLTGHQTIPTDTVLAVRRLQLTLGVARASSTARPAGGAGLAGPSEGTGVLGSTVTGPADIQLPPPVSPQTGAPTARGGIGVGPLKLRINWASMRVKPWPPYDMAKVIAVGAILAGVFLLFRRRFAPPA